MRLLVIALALLAGFKVWTQDRIVRAMMGEAIVQAYRARAEQSCQKQADGAAAAKRPALAFRETADIAIGNPNLKVAIWDVDSPLWDMRFRHPNILLTSARDDRLRCAYDVKIGIANLITN